MQSSPGLQGAPHSLSPSTRVSGPGTDGSGLCLCDRVSTTCPVSHPSEPFLLRGKSATSTETNEQMNTSQPPLSGAGVLKDCKRESLGDPYEEI